MTPTKGKKMTLKTRIVDALLQSIAKNAMYFSATMLYIAYATFTQTPQP